MGPYLELSRRRMGSSSNMDLVSPKCQNIAIPKLYILQSEDFHLQKALKILNSL